MTKEKSAKEAHFQDERDLVTSDQEVVIDLCKIGQNHSTISNTREQPEENAPQPKERMENDLKILFNARKEKTECRMGPAEGRREGGFVVLIFIQLRPFLLIKISTSSGEISLDLHSIQVVPKSWFVLKPPFLFSRGGVHSMNASSNSWIKQLLVFMVHVQYLYLITM